MDLRAHCVTAVSIALHLPECRLSSGVSAVYSFFDPQDPRRGLGTHMILWLADAAARRGLPYVYLGYWIADSSKMAYKRAFRPLEFFGPDGWTELPTA